MDNFVAFTDLEHSFCNRLGGFARCLHKLRDQPTMGRCCCCAELDAEDGHDQILRVYTGHEQGYARACKGRSCIPRKEISSILPSWKRCFTAADVPLLVAAAFRILLQSAPAALSATCKHASFGIESKL